MNEAHICAHTHSALFIRSTVFSLGAQPCMHLHTHAYANSHTFTLTHTVDLASHAVFDEFAAELHQVGK